MTIQGKLIRYESMLPDMRDEDWDRRGWPAPDTRVGMRVDRLWRRIGEDQLMLHRFTREPGIHDPHSHPMAVAAHVLGPGEYEVGFVTRGVCQARMVCDKDFYYEMRTPEVRHFVLPRSEPVYSVAMWTQFPAADLVPPDEIRSMPSPLDHVRAVFDRLT